MAYLLSSLNMPEMDLITLHCFEQKKINKLRRTRGAIDCRESPLTKSGEAFMLKRAEAMKVNEEKKQQDDVNSIGAEGGSDQC